VATHKYGRSFVRHGAWLALVLGFIFIFARGGSTQDESASPTRARDALRQAIEHYESREYEKAAPYFAYVKPIQQTLEPTDRQDFAKFTALNALALKGRKDGSALIRMTEDAVQKGRTKDAGNFLKLLDANQYLTPVERQHVLELRRRLEARMRTASAQKSRPDAKSLLTAGRAALQAGNLPAAEALANRAGQVNSLVPDWLQPWNDSPAKLRRDIRTAQAKQMEIVSPVIVPTTSEPIPSDPNQSNASSNVSGIRPFGNVNLEESQSTELTCVSPPANQIQEPARPQGANDPVCDLGLSGHTDYGASGPYASAGTLGVPIPRLLAWLGVPIQRLAWLGAPIPRPLAWLLAPIPIVAPPDASDSQNEKPSVASLAASDSQNEAPSVVIINIDSQNEEPSVVIINHMPEEVPVPVNPEP
jgi:hypothetical protein